MAPPTAPVVPTDRTLSRLARLRAARDGVLSLYLDLAPAGGERARVQAAVHDALEPLGRRPLAEGPRARLEEERQRVVQFARDEFELHGRSLIVFSCRPRGLWEAFQLQVPVRPLARFADRPFVAQLAAVLDEQERYGVVLLDKEQARILSVYLGRVEHCSELSDDYPGRTAMGGWAQARYARHREAHLHRHVLHVVEAVRAELRRRPFDRLIAGGPDQAFSAFLGVLPRGLRARLVGTFTAELFASDQEVLDRVRVIEEAAQRRAEAELVDHLIDTARGGGLAVLGWDQTLQALGEGRVHKLLLAEGMSQSGRACPEGHFAAVEAAGACPVCGRALQAVADAGEWAVEAAFDTDASVETVRGEAAPALMRERGVGAVLRY